jgi:hypothetical protein
VLKGMKKRSGVELTLCRVRAGFIEVGRSTTRDGVFKS